VGHPKNEGVFVKYFLEKLPKIILGSILTDWGIVIKEQYVGEVYFSPAF